MPNPFYDNTSTVVGDTSPGGSAVGFAAPGSPAKVIDNRYSAGNPFAKDAPIWQAGARQVDINAKAAAAKSAEADAEKPGEAGIVDTTKGIPGGAASVLKGVFTNPLGSAQALVGGLMDVGPATVNILNALGKGILGVIYGKDAVGKETKGGIDLPLPGQTMNEYIGNNSDVSEAIGTGAKQFGSYELGGAGVKAAGITGLAGRIAGNVAGGQLVVDPKSSASDRLKQAAFDAAFGAAEYAGGKVAAKLKGTAATVVTEAKNSAMTNAIDAFEKPGAPGYNPEVGDILRKYLSSKSFDNASTVVDFEGGLQKALGDHFNDPAVQKTIQPIINAAHYQVENALAPKTSQTAPEGPVRPQDVFDTAAFTAKAEARANQKPPQIKYIAKDNLGKDEFGNKRMATTNVDTKTSNAIVYYDKSLDANPEAKKIVFDHEHGHILDKQLNGGSNLSAELPNYTGNKENLDAILGDFAKRNQMTPQEVAAGMQHDIEVLAGENKKLNEAFADAVQKYRADPKTAFETAPTFAKFMEYKPQDSQFTEHSTSLESLKQDSPIAGKMVEQRMKQVAEDAKVKAEGEKAAEAPKKSSKTANGKIASTGLDTGKRVEGRLSFNPEKINAPEDVELLFSKMEAKSESFTKQRISKSKEDIADLARLVGLKQEDLINLKPGSIANAETITAARQLVLNKATSLAEKIKSVDTSTATAAQLKDIKDEFLKLVSMQKSVAGLRTEASNALRSLGVKLTADENFTMKNLLTKLKQMDVASDGDTAVFAKDVAKEFNLSTTDKVAQGALQTWYASILSGPKTSVRNILSTSANIITELASKTVNPKTWKEVAPAVQGLLRGIKAGKADFKKILAGEVIDPGKFIDPDMTRPPVFTGKFAKYGNYVESVGRFLAAQDAVLKSGAKAMEEASLKVSSPEMSDAVTKAVTDWYGEFSVYHGEPRGKGSLAISKGMQTMTNIAPILKVIVPFVKTVANVLDRQFDYMPLTAQLRMRPEFILRETDKIMKQFDLTSATDRKAIAQRLYNQQTGRMILGTAITAAAVVGAANGVVSGVGPTNYSERVQLQRTGWRPNSIKIGKVWVPYTYLGPLGGILSVAGNVHDKVVYDNAPDADITKLIAKGLVGWGQSELSQSFLTGVANLLDVFSGNKDPGSYATDFLTGLIPVPAAWSQTKDIIENIYSHIANDPTAKQQYETQNIVDKLRDKIGLGLGGNIFGKGSALKPKLDQFGDPMTTDLIYGITPSIEKEDLVDNYLTANDIVVTIPPKTQKYSDPNGGKAKALTASQYETYVEKSGKQIYKNLEEMIPSLKDEDIDTQRSEIKSMLSNVRDDIRAEVMTKVK